MAKFRRKRDTVEATRWFTNGDHPEDDCQMIHGCGEPFLSEGKVVRYYREPSVPGDALCPICGQPVHKHGWIDLFTTGNIVCPGDWVITDAQGMRYPVSDGIFTSMYEEVTGED